jgi:hypothetical protein
MIAQLLRFDTSGTIIDQVTCALNDDGNYNVSGSVFSGWNVGGQVTIVLGRARTGSGVLPHNNAGSSLVGVQWMIGAGFQN